MLFESSTSPNRKAAFSRPEPDAGRLPDLRNGDEDLGGDDFVVDPEGASGSSIHEKLDCAIVERVGTGAVGLDGNPPLFTGSIVVCWKSIDEIVFSEAAKPESLLVTISRVGLEGNSFPTPSATGFSTFGSRDVETVGSSVVSCKGL
jgi:hypothetical protein